MIQCDTGCLAILAEKELQPLNAELHELDLSIHEISSQSDDFTDAPDSPESIQQITDVARRLLYLGNAAGKAELMPSIHLQTG